MFTLSTPASHQVTQPVATQPIYTQVQVIGVSGVSQARRLYHDVAIIGQIAPGWIVENALPVRLEQDDDGSYVMSDDIFNVYGDGATLSNVKASYVTSLIEYYEMVAAGSEIDRYDAEQLQHLRRYLHQT